MPILTASIDLPPTAASVPTARHLLLDILRAWDVSQDRDDAALLVTELVANAIDHVQGAAGADPRTRDPAGRPVSARLVCRRRKAGTGGDEATRTKEPTR